MHLVQARSPFAASVAAGFHGHGQILGDTEGADEKRDQDRNQRLGSAHNVTRLKICAPGLLGFHDLIGLIQQGRDKSQRNGHHHRDVVSRQSEALKGAQQTLDSVGQPDWRRRQRKERRPDNQKDQADRHEHRSNHAFHGDLQGPDRPDHPAIHHKDVQQEGEQENQNDRLQSAHNEAERNPGNDDTGRQHSRTDGKSDKIVDDKQLDDKEQRRGYLYSRIQAVNRRLDRIILS